MSETINAEHYNDLPAVAMNELETALDSVQYAISELLIVRDMITSGKFSRALALQTHEDLICNAGLDFLSKIEEYAHTE